jgi:hypothetical protein
MKFIASLALAALVAPCPKPGAVFDPNAIQSCTHDVLASCAKVKDRAGCERKQAPLLVQVLAKAKPAADVDLRIESISLWSKWTCVANTPTAKRHLPKKNSTGTSVDACEVTGLQRRLQEYTKAIAAAHGPAKLKLIRTYCSYYETLVYISLLKTKDEYFSNQCENERAMQAIDPTYPSDVVDNALIVLPVLMSACRVMNEGNKTAQLACIDQKVRQVRGSVCKLPPKFASKRDALYCRVAFDACGEKTMWAKSCDASHAVCIKSPKCPRK